MTTRPNLCRPRPPTLPARRVRSGNATHLSRQPDSLAHNTRILTTVRPQPHQTRPDQTTPGNPSRCDHIPQSLLTTTSHTTTGCGTAGWNHPAAQTTRPMSPPQPQPPHRPTPLTPPDQISDQTRPRQGNPSRCDHIAHNLFWPRPPTRPRGVVRPGGTTPRSKQPDA